MKSGTLIAVLALAAYLGFEAYAIRKVSHRTEPAYIYQLLIEARAAAALCNDSVLGLQPRFESTLARVSESYRQDVLNENSVLSIDDVNDLLAQQVTVAEQNLENTVAEKGCGDKELKAHFQRYRIYARKTRS